MQYDNLVQNSRRYQIDSVIEKKDKTIYVISCWRKFAPRKHDVINLDGKLCVVKEISYEELYFAIGIGSLKIRLEVIFLQFENERCKNPYA